MSDLPTLFYPNGNDLQRGDRVRIEPDGFTSRRFKVDASFDGEAGIVLRQVPFLNVAEVYFPQDGETAVKAGAYVMVEPCNLAIQERYDGAFSLPAIKKYAELDMLASWMQCSVSSQESIDRYEEITDAESIEALCMDYHAVADQNLELKQELEAMAGLLRQAHENTARIFGLGQLSDDCRDAVLAYDAKYGNSRSENT